MPAPALSHSGRDRMARAEALCEPRNVARCAAAMLLAALTVAILAPDAPAHSELASSSPSTGAIVEQPVEDVELVFSEPVDADTSRFEVAEFERNRRHVPAVEYSPDGVTVRLQLQEPVHQGRVEVTYFVRGADTHRRSGAIHFFVGTPPRPTAVANATVDQDLSAQPQTGGTTSGAAPSIDLATPTFDRVAFDRMAGVQDLTRGLGYAAAIMAIGGGLYHQLVCRRRTDARQSRILTGASFGCGLSALVLLSTQAGMSRLGEVGALIDPRAWRDELDGTFGLGIAFRLVGAVGLAATVARLGTCRSRPAMASLALLALSFPLLGHGVSFEPRWLVFPASVVHIVAVSMWGGGLVGLLTDLRASRPLDPNLRIDLINRYGRAAALSVAGAVLSGLVLARSAVDGFGELADTNYGRTLSLKVVVVAALVLLGAVNRYVFLPKLRRSDGTMQLERLLLTGAAEAGIMAFVLMLTMSLTAA